MRGEIQMHFKKLASSRLNSNESLNESVDADKVPIHIESLGHNLFQESGLI